VYAFGAILATLFGGIVVLLIKLLGG